MEMVKSMEHWRKFNPAVKPFWLYLLAGLMWSAVGLMLCSMAYRWLTGLQAHWLALVVGLLGVVFAIAAYRFGFSHLAIKNIQRLETFLERTCVFAFITWKSYLLIVGMMSLGLALRSSLLPREYLALVYTTIGGALFLSSFHYYGSLLRMARERQLVKSTE
jgi:hypothetical protein